MSERLRTPDSDDPWEDLVVSILSVNQYTLENTYRGLGGLHKQGLCDPHNLMEWEQNEIVKRLNDGGFDRGEFMTNLFALRLAHLGEYFANMAWRRARR